ncbi:MAG: hypothetical protein ACRBBK_07305 [Paracoccaceae bacterium]
MEEDIVGLAAEAIMATEVQLVKFEAKLDRYDEATVKALMENQELLDAVNARIDAMLEQAYVMEDGRRVFRTEDGTQVFDEHGTEVSSLVLDPQLIDPALPSWEAYSADITIQTELTAERTAILDYQERLDVAREEIDGGEISEADLEALDADLLDAMPDAVRANVPGLEPSEPEQAVQPVDGVPQVTVQANQLAASALAPFQ